MTSFGPSTDDAYATRDACITEPTTSPDYMWCSYCNKRICSDLGYKRGKRAWLAFGLMVIFLLWPLCLIPLFVNSCKDIEHSCPICQAVLHVHRRPCCDTG